MLFWNAIPKLFRVDCPGQKSVDFCPERNFIGALAWEQLSRRRLIKKKYQGRKSPGGISWVVIFQEVIVQGETVNS